MGLKSGAVDEDIVEENQHKATQTRSQSTIHCTLKCAWRTGKTERHDSELILTKVSLEGGLELFTGLQKDLVKTSSKIQCGEPFSMSELIHQLVEHWHRKLRLPCQRIEMSEVNTKAVGVIFLFDKQYW